jgi:hypothetical protein
MKFTEHPDVLDLALLAGDDLGWWEARKLRRHVNECARCASSLAELEESRADLSKLSGEGLPEGLDWSRMEREMRGNIHLALDCNEAVRKVPRYGTPLDWRAVLALTAMTAVVLTGWFLNARRQVTRPPMAAVEAGFARVMALGNGLELRTGSKQSLTLMAPKEASYSSYSVDTRGGVSARSVDESTGQVTIANVSFE